MIAVSHIVRALSHPSRAAIVAASLLSLAGAPASAASASQAKQEAAGCEAPEFPVRWQEDGDSGTVTLQVLVAPDGKVMASKLLNSSGISRVDRASLKASSRCKFAPTAKDNQSMPAWTRVQYTWVVE